MVEVALANFDNLFSVGAVNQIGECLNAVPNKMTNNMQEV